MLSTKYATMIVQLLSLVFFFTCPKDVLGFTVDVDQRVFVRDLHVVLSSPLSDGDDAISRRDWLATFAATFTAIGMPKNAAYAEDQVVSLIEMKDFVDPKGLFSIRVPQRFFTLRRSAKGDLPDAKTGKGRRGSSIFTAGDMAKAEVVAVER